MFNYEEFEEKSDMSNGSSMYGYLVDPENRTITQIPYSGNYKQIYDLIDAEMFTFVEFNDKEDGLYIDEEGLYRHHHFFKVKGLNDPLCGKGFCLGTSNEKSISPSISLKEFKKLITWVAPIKMGGKIIWIQI